LEIVFRGYSGPSYFLMHRCCNRHIFLALLWMLQLHHHSHDMSLSITFCGCLSMQKISRVLNFLKTFIVDFNVVDFNVDLYQ
jgi:hypothetical protein